MSGTAAGGRGPQPRTPADSERDRLTIGVAFRDYRLFHGDRTILSVSDLRLQGPGLVLLMGASGSGKSLFLRGLAGDTGVLGATHMEGEVRPTVPDAPPRMAYLPQDSLNAFLGFDAATEFLIRERARGTSPRDATARAREQLSALALTHGAELPIAHLSGGERKRLALAALRTGQPHVLLLDEPLNHLDAAWRPRMTEEIVRAATESLVVVATHEAAPFLPAANDLVVLRAGGVLFHGPPAAAPVFPELEPLPDPVPRSLVRSSPARVAAHRVWLTAGERLLLRDANLELGTGVHAIRGPNGSGKTTLLRALAGLHAPARGEIRVQGLEPRALSARERCRLMSYHPEEPSQLFFAASVEEEILFQPINQALTGCDLQARLREVAFDYSLDGLLARHPLSLSGGERERAVLACLDAARTPTVLLDEPTHGLDREGRRLLEAGLRRARDAACIILATHDARLLRLADSVHAIADQRLLPERGPALEVVA